MYRTILTEAPPQQSPQYISDVLSLLGQLQTYSTSRSFPDQSNLDVRRMGIMSDAQFDALTLMFDNWMGDAAGLIVAIRGAANTTPLQPISGVVEPDPYTQQANIPPLPLIRTHGVNSGSPGSYPGNPAPRLKSIIPRPWPPKPRPWPPWPPKPPKPVFWYPTIETDYSYLTDYYEIMNDNYAFYPLDSYGFFVWQYTSMGMFERYANLVGFVRTQDELKLLCQETAANLASILYG